VRPFEGAAWTDWFDLGFVFPAAFPEYSKCESGLAQTLAGVLAEGFFQAVEIESIANDVERSRVRAITRNAGIRVVFLGAATLLSEGLNLSALDEDHRAASVARAMELLEEAHYHGASHLLIGSGPDPGAASRAEAADQLERSVGELCRRAQGWADGDCICITLEHFDRDIDKRFLFGPSLETAEFARRVRNDYENFGVTLDQSHVCQLGETPVEAVGHLDDVVCHVHLANCIIRNSAHELYGDRHPPFCIPHGEVGIEEIGAFLIALADSGLFSQRSVTERPIVSVEVCRPAGAESWATLNETKDTFRFAWQAASQRVLESRRTQTS